MSDYDIRPKPKVLASSPNECRTFGRTLYANLSIIPTLSVQCVSYILCSLFALVCLTMFVCI